MDKRQRVRPEALHKILFRIGNLVPMIRARGGANPAPASRELDVTSETVIDATKSEEWKRKERKKAHIIVGVCAAVFLYTMGTFDVLFVKVGLQGVNMYDCVGTPAGIVYCDGPWSLNKPPAGLSVHDMAIF